MESLQDINPVERALVNKATANRTPINATIELTPTCNFRCDMCYIRMEKSQAEKRGGLRSIEEWLHIADQLQEIGTLFILLTGGEPLLYPDFKELYIRLKEKGFILTINTNATLIDDETVRLFQRLKPRRSECLVIWCDQRNLSQSVPRDKRFRPLPGRTETIKRIWHRYQTEPHLDTTKYKRTPANAGTS